MSFRIFSDDPERRVEQRDNRVSWSLPERIGSCRTDCYRINEGLSLLHTRYVPVVDLVEETRMVYPSRTLILTFGLAGASELSSSQGVSWQFRSGYTTLASFQSNQGERAYKARQPVTQLRLAVDESLLAHYLGMERTADLLGEGHPLLLAHRQSSKIDLQHVQALLHCLNVAPGVDRIGLHVQALNLLALALQPFDEPGPDRVMPLSDDDFMRLEQARQLMEIQFDKPLTLAYLAKSVGLSEHKLKQGFRHYFDTTPYKMLMALRMQRAWFLLETTRCQVAQVAWQVGYEHPGNFSAAFTRFFGYSPKSVAGNKTTLKGGKVQPDIE